MIFDGLWDNEALSNATNGIIYILKYIQIERILKTC